MKDMDWQIFMFKLRPMDSNQLTRVLRSRNIIIFILCTVSAVQGGCADFPSLQSLSLHTDVVTEFYLGI